MKVYLIFREEYHKNLPEPNRYNANIVGVFTNEAEAEKVVNSLNQRKGYRIVPEGEKYPVEGINYFITERDTDILLFDEEQ